MTRPPSSVFCEPMVTVMTQRRRGREGSGYVADDDSPSPFIIMPNPLLGEAVKQRRGKGKERGSPSLPEADPH